MSESFVSLVLSMITIVMTNHRKTSLFHDNLNLTTHVAYYWVNNPIFKNSASKKSDIERSKSNVTMDALSSYSRGIFFDLLTKMICEPRFRR
uniref:Secreted protein n=1 Tax=Thelazia callipaeda TaxID=103827 RepID=A0A0N5D9Z7_THECL